MKFIYLFIYFQKNFSKATRLYGMEIKANISERWNSPQLGTCRIFIYIFLKFSDNFWNIETIAYWCHYFCSDSCFPFSKHEEDRIRNQLFIDFTCAPFLTSQIVCDNWLSNVSISQNEQLISSSTLK
jgi:hypothetical protein